MDFPKVGVNLPRLPALDEAVETAKKAASLAGEASQKEAPAAPGGGGDTFERVAVAGQSAFAALVGPVAGGAGHALEDAARIGERAAGSVGRFVQDPVGGVARLGEAFALGFGTSARRATDHVKEAMLDQLEDTGLADDGLGAEALAHAVGDMARRVGERVGERADEVAEDAAEAEAPITDAVAAATAAGADVIVAVGGAVSDAADAVGDAAGAAWDALTVGGS